MTIQSIVEAVLKTHVLTLAQETKINSLVWMQRVSDADMEALDHLTQALMQGQVITDH
ncbi:MAG: hypothetical protein HC921_08480 [Synechococcaceae cyanobacterium SM2_3_1]|nr:hypothetical protein [Synechococcaceae cyanobacterium SM2_3_1]